MGLEVHMLPKSKLFHALLLVLVFTVGALSFFVSQTSTLRAMGISAGVIGLMTNLEILGEALLKKIGGGGVTLIVAFLLLGGFFFSACGGVSKCLNDPKPTPACLAAQDVVTCTDPLLPAAGNDVIAAFMSGATPAQVEAEFAGLGLKDAMCLFTEAIAQLEAGKFAPVPGVPGVSVAVARAWLADFRTRKGVGMRTIYRTPAGHQ
jgi:hypothetical protein